MLLALAAGCGSTRHDEPFVEELSVPGESRGMQADPRVESRLATVIESSREVAGVKSYRLSLRNVSGESIDVSWTVDWFDRAGVRIASARRTWQRVQLDAGASTPIEITAPGAAADSWRLVSVDPATLP